MIKTEAYNESKQFLGLTKKNGVKASKLYTQKPLGFFSVTRNLPAYRTNQDGVLELMGANVPRIDYANGCPELLVENEATNLLLRSQEFDNASWDKLNVTINANATNAPDGTLTGDTLTANAGNNAIYQVKNLSNVLTLSIFAKANSSNFIYLDIFDINPPVDYVAIFNLSNGTYVGNGGFGNVDSYTIKYVNNGWYKITVTKNVGNLGNHNFIYGVANGNALNAIIGSSVYIWGAQLEQGNKATSYIPTTTTAVTRPVDNVRNNTIGYDNEESTIFVRARLNFTTDYQGIATLWDGDDIDNGYITMFYCISGGVRYILFDTYNGSDTNQYLYTAPSDGVYNIAFAYHTGERTYRIAINGVLITDDEFPNNFPSYTLLTQMTLGSFFTYFNSRTKGFMYFDSMLDNDSLENLTVQ